MALPAPNRAPASPKRVIGRYAIFNELAAGGMAVVHLGKLLGPVGFARTVAIKQLHPQYASDPEFVAMFLDEARLAARVRHPNVVATLDVVVEGKELFLVMDYVQGESMARLLRGASRREDRTGPALAVNVMLGVLAGLHAAHEATTENGAPLGLVHRDVSPQNVIVGVDGVARVLDFGIAKAAGRLQLTRDGERKGKTAYMAPEQIQGTSIDRRADVFGAAVVLWEALTLQRLFQGANEAESMFQVLKGATRRPSDLAPGISPELDAAVMRALSPKPEDRFDTALDFSLALERTVPILTAREIGAWVRTLASEALAKREGQLELVESSPTPAPDMPDTVDLGDLGDLPTANELPDPATTHMRRAEAPPASAPEAKPEAKPFWSHRTTILLAIVCVLQITGLIAWWLWPTAPPAATTTASATVSASASASAPAPATATATVSAPAPATAPASASAVESAAPARKSAAPASSLHRSLYKRE